MSALGEKRKSETFVVVLQGTILLCKTFLDISFPCCKMNICNRWCSLEFSLTAFCLLRWNSWCIMLFLQDNQPCYIYSHVNIVGFFNQDARLMFPAGNCIKSLLSPISHIFRHLGTTIWKQDIAIWILIFYSCMVLAGWTGYSNVIAFWCFVYTGSLASNYPRATT